MQQVKYTLSQYVHDSFRLKAIEAEKKQLRAYGGSYDWVHTRLAELFDMELTLNERMAKFEKHPHNR